MVLGSFLDTFQKIADSASNAKGERKRFLLAMFGLTGKYPTTNGGMQNGSSVGICTHRVHVFCTFGSDLHAQSVLIDEISASELSRKFIKSELLVGYEYLFPSCHSSVYIAQFF